MLYTEESREDMRRIADEFYEAQKVKKAKELREQLSLANAAEQLRIDNERKKRR